MQGRSKTTNRKGKFIRDFNDVREIARKISLYGCFTKSDFINRGGLIRFGGAGREKGNMSRSGFETQLSRIAFYLPAGFLDTAPEGGAYSFETEGADEDAMLEMFRYKNFTYKDIQGYIFLQQILGKNGGWMSMSDLRDALMREYMEFDIRASEDEDVVYARYLDPLSQTFKNKADGLVAAGLAERSEPEKTGIAYSYRLAPDAFETLSDEALEELWRLLDLLSRSSPLQAPFYLARKKTELYAELERGFFPMQFPSRYKGVPAAAALDSIQMTELLECARAKETAEITWSPANAGAGRIVTGIFLPAAAVHDAVTGRQYFICVSEDHEKPLAVRLDSVHSVVPGKPAGKELKERAEEAARLIDRTWLVSFGTNGSPGYTDIRFSCGPGKEYVRRRVFREAPEAEIISESDGYMTCRIPAGDAREMIPWIRSFGENAVSLDGVIRKTILDGWRNLEKGKLREDSRGMAGRPAYTGIGSDARSSIFTSEESAVYEAAARAVCEAEENGGMISAKRMEALLRQCTSGTYSHYEMDADSGHGYYGIFGNAGNGMLVPKVTGRVPVRLTKAEKDAIINALETPEAEIMMSPEALDKARAAFPEGQASWSLKDIIIKGRPRQEHSANTEEMHKAVACAIEALDSGTGMRAVNKTPGRIRQGIFYPECIEYSSADGLFRIDAYVPEENRHIQIRADRLKNAEPAEEEIPGRADYEAFLEERGRQAVIRLASSEYAVERAVRVFSAYRTKISQDPGTGGYLAELSYRDFEEDRVIRDVLSCGDFVLAAKGPLAKKIQKRIIKAREAYETVDATVCDAPCDAAG